jgi:hypothetical protein
LTTIATEIEQDLILHSNAEDAYVLARGDIKSAQISTNIVSEKAADEAPTATKVEEELLPEDPEQNELPQSTTTYKMSEDVFRAAKNADPRSADSYWSHTLYRGPEVDGVAPKVKVHYCKSKHTTERVCQEYFKDKKILGFDIEWKPESTKNHGPKKNVSLIQLACDERIALFHIALYQGDKIEDLVAPTLKKIMEDASITKVGVAIKADCTRLRKFLDIHSQGIFELSHLYKLVKFSSTEEVNLINKRLVSLAVQVQDHLHLPLFKGEVRGSDWSLPVPLRMDQIIYAASDSYAGIHLYDTMEIKRKALDPTPPRPYFAEENKPIRLAQGVEIPTDDELDGEEPEQITSTKRTTKFSSKYLANASESLEMDPDFEALPSTSPATAPPTTRSKFAPSKLVSPPKDPLVAEAGAQADLYRATHHQNRAAPSSLRCYFLWHHNPDLSIQEIAALLRDVPLQTSTVINYILESVKVEKLPFDKERLKEVLGFLPKEVVQSRYRTLARACGEEFPGKESAEAAGERKPE